MRFALYCVCVMYLVCVMGVGSVYADVPLPEFVKERLGSDRLSGSVMGYGFGEGKVATVDTGGWVRVWDIAKGTVRWDAQPIKGPLGEVVFGGEDLVIAGAETGEVFVFQEKDGKEVWRQSLELCQTGRACTLVSLRASGSVLVTLASHIEGSCKGCESGQPDENGNRVDQYDKGSTLRVWSLADGKLLQSHTTDLIQTFALSASGEEVAWVFSGYRYKDEGETYAARANIAALDKPMGLVCPFIEGGDNDVIDEVRVIFSPASKTLVVFDGAFLMCVWSMEGDSVVPEARVIEIPHRDYGDDGDDGEDVGDAGDPMQRREDFDVLFGGALFSSDGRTLSVTHEVGYRMREGVWGPETTAHHWVDIASGKVTSMWEHQALPKMWWASNPEYAPIPTGGKAALGLPLYRVKDDQGHFVLSAGYRFGVYMALPLEAVLSKHSLGFIVAIVANMTGDEVVSTDIYGKGLVWRSKQKEAQAAVPVRGTLAISPSGGLYDTGTAILPVFELGEYCTMEEKGQEGDIGMWDTQRSTPAYKSLRADPKLMIHTLHWLADGQMLVCREEHEADGTSCGESMGKVTSGFEILNNKAQLVSTLKAKFTFCPPQQVVSVAALRAMGTVDTDTPPHKNVNHRAIFDLATGNILTDLPAVQGNFFALSPDGKYYGFLAEGAKVQIYDVDAQAFVAALKLSEAPSFNFYSDQALLLFSPESKHLIAADKDKLLMFDLTTKTTVKTLHAHTAPITALTFSGDGKTLFSAHADGLIDAWDWPVIQAAALGAAQ